LTDVTLGEGLIKATYEAIRQSAFWEKSLFIVTWDEHGGFYDHAVPPAAIPPDDTKPGDKYNQYGFTFAQYGPRVPALVMSPLIPKSLIDHRLYDHTSIPATLESIFGLNPLTERDKAAKSLDKLVTLAAIRDTPRTLPDPAVAVPGWDKPADDGNVPGIIQAALRQHLESVPQNREAIIARVKAIKTRSDAKQYLEDVKQAVALPKADAAEQ
jgi:phospholipase C